VGGNRASGENEENEKEYPQNPIISENGTGLGSLSDQEKGKRKGW